MKKVISVLLILVFVLSGCSSKNNIAIENYDWSFSRITQEDNGEVLFVSAENEVKYTNTKTIALECSVTADEIIISDNATGESWNLKYVANEDIQASGNEGTIYNITYSTENDVIKGYATTGAANRNNVDSDYYLIITIKNYQLYFIDTAE